MPMTPMTSRVFTHWLLHAEPHEVMTYHTGKLHIGTLHSGGRERSLSLARLADRVRAASDGGFVTLTQLRLGEDNYAYLARRTGEIAG